MVQLHIYYSYKLLSCFFCRLYLVEGLPVQAVPPFCPRESIRQCAMCICAQCVSIRQIVRRRALPAPIKASHSGSHMLSE